MNRKSGAKAGEALQHSYSLREKALTLTRECEEAYKAGRIGESEYRSLQEFYARQVHRAEERIAHLRREHRHRADLLRQELQETARRQAELMEMATAREIHVSRANRLNRRYEAQLAHLRTRFQEEDRLAAARNAADVGGFIDIPLDRATAHRADRRAGRIAIGRLAATAAAVIGSLSVFLPWLALDSERHSLAALPARFGFEQTFNGPLLGLLLVFVVLPLVGAVFAWMENLHWSGRGMVATGVAAILLTVAGVGAAAAAASGLYLASEVLVGLRWGAWLYFASGLALVVFGLQRARAAQAAPGARASRFILLGGAIVALLVLGAVVYATTRSGGYAEFQFVFSPPAPPLGVIHVTGTNMGTADALLYVPWPEGRARSALVERRRNAFGLLMYVRERGGAEFKLYPSSQECWLHNDRPVSPGAPLTVAPEVSVRITCDPAATRQGGLNPEAVRITATDASGKTVASFEAAVPSPAPITP